MRKIVSTLLLTAASICHAAELGRITDESPRHGAYTVTITDEPCLSRAETRAFFESVRVKTPESARVVIWRSADSEVLGCYVEHGETDPIVLIVYVDGDRQTAHRSRFKNHAL